MDFMQVLEDTAQEFTHLKNVVFVEYMLDRQFAIAAIDDDFMPSNEAKRITLENYLERRFPCVEKAII